MTTVTRVLPCNRVPYRESSWPEYLAFLLTYGYMAFRLGAQTQQTEFAKAMTDYSVASCDSGCSFPPAYLHSRSSNFLRGECIATVNLNLSTASVTIRQVRRGSCKTFGSVSF